MNHQNLVADQKKSIQSVIDEMKFANEINYKNKALLISLSNRLSFSDPQNTPKQESAIQYEEGYIGEMRQLTNEALEIANKTASLISEIEKHI